MNLSFLTILSCVVVLFYTGLVFATGNFEKCAVESKEDRRTDIDNDCSSGRLAIKKSGEALSCELNKIRAKKEVVEAVRLQSMVFGGCTNTQIKKVRSSLKNEILSSCQHRRCQVFEAMTLTQLVTCLSLPEKTEDSWRMMYTHALVGKIRQILTEKNSAMLGEDILPAAFLQVMYLSRLSALEEKKVFREVIDFQTIPHGIHDVFLESSRSHIAEFTIIKQVMERAKNTYNENYQLSQVISEYLNKECIRNPIAQLLKMIVSVPEDIADCLLSLEIPISVTESVLSELSEIELQALFEKIFALADDAYDPDCFGRRLAISILAWIDDSFHTRTQSRSSHPLLHRILSHPSVIKRLSNETIMRIVAQYDALIIYGQELSFHGSLSFQEFVGRIKDIVQSNRLDWSGMYENEVWKGMETIGKFFESDEGFRLPFMTIDELITSVEHYIAINKPWASFVKVFMATELAYRIEAQQGREGLFAGGSLEKMQQAKSILKSVKPLITIRSSLYAGLSVAKCNKRKIDADKVRRKKVSARLAADIVLKQYEESTVLSSSGLYGVSFGEVQFAHDFVRKHNDKMGLPFRLRLIGRQYLTFNQCHSLVQEVERSPGDIENLTVYECINLAQLLVELCRRKRVGPMINLSEALSKRMVALKLGSCEGYQLDLLHSQLRALIVFCFATQSEEQDKCLQVLRRLYLADATHNVIKNCYLFVLGWTQAVITNRDDYNYNYNYNHLAVIMRVLLESEQLRESMPADQHGTCVDQWFRIIKQLPVLFMGKEGNVSMSDTDLRKLLPLLNQVTEKASELCSLSTHNLDEIVSNMKELYLSLSMKTI